VSEEDKEMSRHLTQLAVDNPQQLPISVLEVMKQRLVKLLTSRMTEILESSLRELEEQLRRAFDVENDNSKGELH
jgi:hypothetical protein